MNEIVEVHLGKGFGGTLLIEFDAKHAHNGASTCCGKLRDGVENAVGQKSGKRKETQCGIGVDLENRLR